MYIGNPKFYISCWRWTSKKRVIQVKEIWCKICAKYQPSSETRGVAIKASQSMTTGCTTVAKHTVDRHVKHSLDHKRCLERQQALLPCERVFGVSSPDSVQPKVDKVLKDTTTQATRKLIETAYHVGKTPTMPLSHFKLMCTVQTRNGVNLLQSKQSYFYVFYI